MLDWKERVSISCLTLLVQKIKKKRRGLISWNVKCNEVGKAYIREVVHVKDVSRVLTG